MLGLFDGAEVIGFKAFGAKVSFEQLIDRVPLPCIIRYSYEHYAVVYKVSANYVWLADPSRGKRKLNKYAFNGEWISEQNPAKGYALLIEPTQDFNDVKEIAPDKQALSYFLKYVRPFKKEFIQILFGIFFSIIISFIIPFISQSVIDVGINNQNLNFIQLIILAQVILLFSTTAVTLIQSWIKLHMGMKMSISMLSDFIMKLMKLPISFFHNRKIGDILQRMSDNGRVLAFVSGTPLSLLVSIITLIIYSVVMVLYSVPILIVFLAGNAIYAFWLFFFLNKRKQMDYEGFELNAQDESKTLELINGIQDIKLNNVQREKRWEWETIKADKYTLSMRGLRLSQIQGTGAQLITQTKDIAISYIAAKAVIEGEMTLGMMFAVQYMIGQLQQPFSTFIGLIHSIQDVKISLERLAEVTQKDDEDTGSHFVESLPNGRNIVLSNVSFRYEGKSSDLILDSINLQIPENKITVIVGRSGSGKSTLLKLLLKLYVPSEGEIFIEKTNLQYIRNAMWREHCGTVMSDGFLFNGSIRHNIVMKDDVADINRFESVCAAMNIDEFADKFPMKYLTEIGSDNVRISEGQKQRILLARALYKNGDYLILDEATSSLDTENEIRIMEHLHALKSHKTIIISAHRLNTIMFADNIIVIDKGRIIQVGTHDELIQEKNNLYYHLVSNKIDL